MTGPVHSGKTTRIAEWIKNKKNTGGILSPVCNGKRYLMSISGKEKKLLEADMGKTDRNDVITAGKYFFLKNVFKWGNEELIKQYKSNCEWFVIDEIGVLELESRKIINNNTGIFKKNDISDDKKIKAESLINKFNLKGLEPAVSFILSDTEMYPDMKFIIAVRDYLLGEVIKYYEFDEKNIEILKNEMPEFI